MWLLNGMFFVSQVVRISVRTLVAHRDNRTFDINVILRCPGESGPIVNHPFYLLARMNGDICTTDLSF